MTEKHNVPDSVSVPGGFERTPDRANAFLAPIHRMLADKVIRQHATRHFVVVGTEQVRIEDSQGRVIIVLDPGTHFVSMTWDFNQQWHLCCIDWTKRG